MTRAIYRSGDTASAFPILLAVLLLLIGFHYTSIGSQLTLFQDNMGLVKEPLLRARQLRVLQLVATPVKHLTSRNPFSSNAADSPSPRHYPSPQRHVIEWDSKPPRNNNIPNGPMTARTHFLAAQQQAQYRDRSKQPNKSPKLSLMTATPAEIGAHYLHNAIRFGIDVLLVSHGGVSSNSFATYLERQGLRIKNHYWHTKLCHYPFPPSLRSYPKEEFEGLKMAIYLHGDPVLSICSMKRQDNQAMNLVKLNDGKVPDYSDKALLRAIYAQFKAWTSEGLDVGYPIYVFHYEQSFTQSCIDNIYVKLGRSLPRTTRTRFGRHNSDRQKCLESLDLDEEDLKLADEINNYRSNLEC